MSINGIGTTGYQTAGHQAGKAERNAASGAKTFMETVAEKSVQDKVIEYGEKAFDLAGATTRAFCESFLEKLKSYRREKWNGCNKSCGITLSTYRTRI